MIEFMRMFGAALLAVFCLAGASFGAEWKPAGDNIMTRWAAEVSPEAPLPEYPRPTLRRAEWMNLNGLWDYAITDRAARRPEVFEGRILVPFPVESALSGVGKSVGHEKTLWHRREFVLPESWSGRRVLLHFGAVDWEAAVWVNGAFAGSHRGGYDAFTFDVTPLLKRTGAQEVVVSAWDPTDMGFQPRGKQAVKPGGIWYTAVTGIWRTVWLEPAPSAFIERVKITPDADRGAAVLEATVNGDCEGCRIEAEVLVEGNTKSRGTAEPGRALTLNVPDAVLWSPDNPFLYDLKLKLVADGKPVDSADGYLALRKIEVKQGSSGAPRLYLNGGELFQYGPLDQGWWPDGLYTAPTDAALRHDVETAKALGFNMLRKHVKVEPERFYYWCDKLGVMVWQDMPNGDAHIFGEAADLKRGPQSARQYEGELKAMIDGLYNHPSVVVWVPFNEGWGQFDTARIVEWIEAYDPTRLVNGASGWTDRGVGDVWDIHVYPGPAAPPGDGRRASVLGEFGGAGLPVEGHAWNKESTWGYKKCESREELRKEYFDLLDKLRFLIWDGLSAAVYTQLTDVEIEGNGFMTYDRDVLKVDPEAVRRANEALYRKVPAMKILAPTARQGEFPWKYRTSEPEENWFATDYDDSGWKTGPGGFGDDPAGRPLVRTEWKQTRIWLRREFASGESGEGGLYLSLASRQDCRVYLNGKPAVMAEGGADGYRHFPLKGRADELLRPGGNVLALECRKQIQRQLTDPRGGFYVDAGIVTFEEAAAP